VPSSFVNVYTKYCKHLQNITQIWWFSVTIIATCDVNLAAFNEAPSSSYYLILQEVEHFAIDYFSWIFIFSTKFCLSAIFCIHYW